MEHKFSPVSRSFLESSSLNPSLQAGVPLKELEVVLMRVVLTMCEAATELGKSLKEDGKRSGMRPEARETALVFFRRFFTRHSLTAQDKHIVAQTCLFVAGKIEDDACHLEKVIIIYHRARDLPGRQNISMEEAAVVKERILKMELVLLQTLMFDLASEHSSVHIENAVNSLRDDSELEKKYGYAPFLSVLKATAMLIATECSRTAMAVMFTTPELTCFAIHQAALKTPSMPFIDILNEKRLASMKRRNKLGSLDETSELVADNSMWFSKVLSEERMNEMCRECEREFQLLQKLTAPPKYSGDPTAFSHGVKSRGAPGINLSAPMFTVRPSSAGGKTASSAAPFQMPPAPPTVDSSVAAVAAPEHVNPPLPGVKPAAALASKPPPSAKPRPPPSVKPRPPPMDASGSDLSSRPPPSVKPQPPPVPPADLSSRPPPAVKPRPPPVSSTSQSLNRPPPSVKPLPPLVLASDPSSRPPPSVKPKPPPSVLGGGPDSTPASTPPTTVHTTQTVETSYHLIGVTVVNTTTTHNSDGTASSSRKRAGEDMEMDESTGGKRRKIDEGLSIVSPVE